MKFLVSILLVLSLTGCATAEKICREAIITNDTVQIDPRSLAECAPLKYPSNKSFEAILEVTKDNTLIYNECASKQRDSVLIIKRFSNIK